MTIKQPLRILIVEDDELFRLGLSTRLQRETSLQIVAEATDSESAIALTNQIQPDVVLLDVGLPGIGGVEACRQIKQQHPNIPVLVLTAHSQKPLIEQLIAAGASGFCLKGIEAQNLFLALQSVAIGASWWDQRSTQEIHTSYVSKQTTDAPINPISPNPALENPIETVSPKKDSPLSLLTQREREILALVAKGKSNKEIAHQLNITAGTVRVHVHSILRKLDVRDRTQAAILALQEGLIATPNNSPTPNT